MWIVILVAVLLVLIYFLGVKNYKYWEERGVPTLKPWPFVGNYGAGVFRRRNNVYIFDEAYTAFPDRRYFGYYSMTSPALFLRDPELIKKIAIKEFETFPQHRPFINEDIDPTWSKNLFAMSGGAKWQDMRATLSPAFTSSKMRMMFGLIKQCAKQFCNYYLKQGGTVTLEMKDAFTRFANDVIATTAFGVTSDSLEQRENEFYLMGKEATDLNGIRGLSILLYGLSPTLAKLAKIPLFPKEVKVFFSNLVRETIKVREEQGIIRPDMIHLLTEAKKGRLKHEDHNSGMVDSGFAAVEESEIGKIQKRQKAEITDDDIIAQALLFFFAGFDTVSTMLCHVSYELALNPDIQEKLRKEVDEALENSKEEITYEMLLGMKYLDMVVSEYEANFGHYCSLMTIQNFGPVLKCFYLMETLRKWPPNVLTDRESVRPFTIEAERPGEKPLHLEAGSVLLIPIHSIHRDPQNYPNPDKFDPERFSEENKHNIKPGAYLPFGVGPRNCIGSRFALLEAKLVVAEIISKFELIPVEKTPIPIVLSRKHFAPVPEGGFWLGLKPRCSSN